MEGAARPGGEPGAPGRGQLRERLLRRHPRHGRRPGRPDAARRLRGRLAGIGEAGGVPGVRRRRCRRAGARGLHRLVAGRRRPRVGARRVVLHGRLPPVRLPRPRGGDGVRLLRPGRGGRHDVRPDRDLRAPCPVRRGRGRRAGLRDPRGQQPARHPDRHPRRQAHPRGRPRRRPHAWALPAARAGRVGRVRRGRRLHHLVGACSASASCCPPSLVSARCCRARSARRWCRCSSRPAWPSSPGPGCSWRSRSTLTPERRS